ncbi:MAG TPA: hypothetical protein VF772_04655, partial [Terriglobales bacterium]
ERIDSLTLSDAYSRYLLRCQAVEKTNAERVRAFEAVFRGYGLPQATRTDNGPGLPPATSQNGKPPTFRPRSLQSP